MKDEKIAAVMGISVQEMKALTYGQFVTTRVTLELAIEEARKLKTHIGGDAELARHAALAMTHAENALLWLNAIPWDESTLAAYREEIENRAMDQPHRGHDAEIIGLLAEPRTVAVFSCTCGRSATVSEGDPDSKPCACGGVMVRMHVSTPPRFDPAD